MMMRGPNYIHLDRGELKEMGMGRRDMVVMEGMEMEETKMLEVVGQYWM